jgi:hypothetical protein
MSNSDLRFGGNFRENRRAQVIANIDRVHSALEKEP